MKDRIDELYGDYKFNGVQKTQITEQVLGFHFYHSMVVVEKNILPPKKMLGGKLYEQKRKNDQAAILDSKLKNDPMLLFSEFNLTESQTEKIQNILSGHRTQQSEHAADENDADFASSVAAIKEILTPGQLEQFNKLLKNFDQS